MNIFYLHTDTEIAAAYHCDKHVVKMIVEYAQILSTAHRVLDGQMTQVILPSGRKSKRYILDDVELNDNLYLATHINHPSVIWARSSLSNYRWLLSLLEKCLKQYFIRYGKIHKTQSILHLLQKFPNHIKVTMGMTAPPLCMPDKYKMENPVASYRLFYIQEKRHFAKWKPPTKTPDWFLFGKWLTTPIDNTLNNNLEVQFAHI